MKVQCIETDARGLNARPLLQTGLFSIEAASQTTIREYNSVAEAESAANVAPNRRPGSKLIFIADGKIVGRDPHQLQHPGALA